MTLFFKADAAIIANVDFPDPRNPTNAREASEVKIGILPLEEVNGGVGVLDVTSDASDDELIKAYGLSRPSTLTGPSLRFIMAANDLLTPAIMFHSASIPVSPWASWDVYDC